MNGILLSYIHFVKIVCRLIFDIIPCYIIFIFLQVDWCLLLFFSFLILLCGSSLSACTGRWLWNIYIKVISCGMIHLCRERLVTELCRERVVLMKHRQA